MEINSWSKVSIFLDVSSNMQSERADRQTDRHTY